MKLHNLPQTKHKNQKRVGRGYGSGKAKTSGRGTKGTKSRTKVKLFFEGGALPLIKRLPMLRGKGRNRPLKPSPIEINLDDLNKLPKNSKVDVDALTKNKIVDESAKIVGVKVLANGKLEKPLTVSLKVSKGAQKQIEKSGGKVETDLSN